MRKILTTLVVLGLSVVVANASTISVNAVATPVVGTPGLYNVDILVNSASGINTTDGDGGVAVVQFDVLSAGTNKAAPLPQGTGPNANKAKTTYDANNVPLSSFGTQSVPAKRDGTLADNPLGAGGNTIYIPDGDLDAMTGLLADTGLTYGSTQVGVAGFMRIATQQWQLTNPAVPETLNIVLSGSSYYDFDATLTNSLVSYTTNGQSSVLLPAVPEPASFVMMGLAGIGLVVARRRSK